MNTKDFVVIPWGKPGNSVKLKYKNAQELQMEKIQLELENQKMEKKFREFQSTWNKRKEEVKSSGYHWKSGSVGKLSNLSHLTSQSKGNATKLPVGNVKLKLLKEQIQAPAKQLVNYKMAHSFGSEKPKTKRKVCGQCENKAALLVCLECGEDYCSGCFAKMHQKGALKFHRTTLIQAKSQILSSVLDVAHQFIKEVNPPNEGNTSTEASSKTQKKPKALLLQENSSEVETRTAEGGEGANSKYNPLYETTFDEEASAQSFREALNQWRAGHQEGNTQQNSHATKPVFIFIDSVEECEVQTNLKIWTEPINIEFTEDSLSYMEKLWLKKHRRTPQEQLRNILPNTFPHPREATMEEQSSPEENDADSDVEEIKVKYPPLFMPVEKVNIERPPPSLTIVELDGTHEAECEEPENAVPYRVELADAESQLSSTIPDYRNCFPRENDIHQHLVFNKVTKDLLSFCLRTNSAYHKDDFKGSSNTNFGNTVESGIYSHEFKKIEETSSFEQNVAEKNIDPGNHQNSGDSCTSFWSKGSLTTVDLDTSFIEENSSQDTSTSLEYSNLKERPNLEDSKTTKSPPLLQEIALRKKPINERYQGLEKFFAPGTNERFDSHPSPNIGCSHSCSSITFTEDKVWIPDSSLSGHAGSAVALYDQQSAENPLPNMQEQKTGQKSQRPSTANFSVSNSARKGSSCWVSSSPRPRSVATQSLSRAASEISEIEYIDVTDQNEPFLDNTEDQQALDRLEKELNVLRNLADPSEQLQSLPSEDLQTFTHHPLNFSQMSEDLLEMSCENDACKTESSSSGRNTEMQSLLSLGDYSTDEEEEDFLVKQCITTLPWAKNV
ncbi:zinc finger B-box domain-containing protein 1 isoform X3 [Peromyscus californicus insignis]|uniref:zinc finger B-box domain-containing protein 1 isoform X3 n=1 Tax=Peromyscus californicus insignis TaxID=564181 RepID=UPI0022A7FADF|nr:zinc finger B-box domain-containing protein 1 isoform X3 [Peromyscus californicus insignis]